MTLHATVVPNDEASSALDLLLGVLPPRVRGRIDALSDPDALLEVVLDLGRQPEARFSDRAEALGEEPVERGDLDYTISRLSAFTNDNRAGIERTLHRISAMRNRHGDVVGLTCRVGRAVYGTVEIVRDWVESGKSVLLLGRPGVGKTTLLREAGRVLADDLGRRVVIVDTSNEIGGDGDIPHPGIGRARRMQVPSPDQQHAVMIEAVENHMPEVVVIDEIGTEAEALAARTIAERGVQLIATAHGTTLDNLVTNPTLADLIGGIHAVILGDDEARRRRTQKTVLERKAAPTFDVLIEIHDRDRFAVHGEVALVVDALLRGQQPRPEIRVRRGDGRYDVENGTAPLPFPRPTETHLPAPPPPIPMEPVEVQERGYEGERERRPVRIFPYAVSRERLERAVRDLGVPAIVSMHPRNADVVLTLRSLAKKRPKKLRELVSDRMRLYAIGGNSPSKITGFLRDLFELPAVEPEQHSALKATEAAIAEVIAKRRPVTLEPQNAYVRRLQHELIEAYGLVSESNGRDPHRCIIIHPAER